MHDGQAVYAEYADEVAKPRLERELRRARKAVTGSHLGWNGTLDVQVRTAGGGFARIEGERYWRDRHWQPEAYWAFQDRILAGPRLRGSVEVGPIDALEGADTP